MKIMELPLLLAARKCVILPPCELIVPRVALRELECILRTGRIPHAECGHCLTGLRFAVDGTLICGRQIPVLHALLLDRYHAADFRRDPSGRARKLLRKRMGSGVEKYRAGCGRARRYRKRKRSKIEHTADRAGA